MQLTYNENPGMGRAGMLADTRTIRHVMSKIASGTVKAGLGVFKVPGANSGPGTHPDMNPGVCYQNPSPAAAADVDAIHGSTASADAGVTVLAAAANGVVGDDTMYPPRQLTAVLSNHADWDAGVLAYSYINEDGESVTENLVVPNTGNTTLTTTGYAVRFVSAAFDAASMAGTGASFTLGIAALDSSVTASDFLGVALYDAATVESPDPLTDPEYADGATIPTLRVGAVWVETEDTCSEGGAVYVRTASGAGGSQLGAFRSDADTASAILVPNARWARNSTAGGLNIVEFYS